MKISPAWLQTFFASPLPDSNALSEALTFHVAEVEEITPDYLEVKVLPDRAAYMLSHRGVAHELSAILELPLKQDPLREEVPEFPSTDRVTVSVENPEMCSRYMAALVEGVQIGPSPAWLKEALESVGQRSINNVVDATNYVMLTIGQPLHAFDAKLLTNDAGTYAIGVRGARPEEKITTLTDEVYELPEGTLLITDAHVDLPIGIAGIKGGKAAAITNTTTDIIIESAHFDGRSVRTSAQALKLFTDASLRFQNRPSPALVAYAMRDVLACIQKIAGGELVGVTDLYAGAPEIVPVTVSLEKLNGILGAVFSDTEVRGVFDRLGFTYTEAEGVYTILPPFERSDVVIPENVAEEVGRILGYDRITGEELPGLPSLPSQTQFRGTEHIKDFLTERGFSEVSLQAFGTHGDIALANALQQDKPWLRASLVPNMKEALARAVAVAPRALGTEPIVKLFEAGTIFKHDGETLAVVLAVHAVDGKESESVLKEYAATIEQELLQTPGAARFSLEGSVVEFLVSPEQLIRLGEGYEPNKVKLGPYEPFSLYPFALRDIAVWTPAGTPPDLIEKLITDAAGSLLVRSDSFDTFEKDGRISYAFRLVFESPLKTLSDTELVPVMEAVTKALNDRDGFEVR